MKLRRLFPAAALCLSVGIAFAVAEEPADEDSRNELIYSFGESAAPAKEDNPMARALLQYAGATDPGQVWGAARLMTSFSRRRYPFVPLVSSISYARYKKSDSSTNKTH